MSNKFWKIMAIVSMSLLIVVVGTSSYRTSSSYRSLIKTTNADLGTLCDKLNSIAYELEGINYQLEKLTDAVNQ